RVGHRGDDDGIDVGRLETGHLEGTSGGRLGHLDDALALTGEVTGFDAGPLLDPLVRGVDRLDDLGVRDDAAWAVGADTRDAGVRRPGCGRDESGHGQPSWGCRRRTGWPGETGSPSSTSHSTTRPPCGATTS